MFDYSQVPEKELELLKEGLKCIISEYESCDGYFDEVDACKALLLKIKKDCKAAADVLFACV